jgi:hypothetical protein
MLKIVDVHPCHVPEGEYIVLQNKGTLTVPLRGCALCADSYLSADPHSAMREMYIFREDDFIKPYGRVVLFTGYGEDGWQPTTDGRRCYVAYWRRDDCVWSRCENVHLLRIESTHRVVDARQFVEAPGF